MKQIWHIGFLIIFMLWSCQTKNNQPNKDDIDHHLAMARLTEFTQQCWNNQNLTMIDSFISPQASRWANGVHVATNRLEFQAHMKVYLKAFPDLSVRIDSMAVSGSKAFVRWRFKGTNTGEFAEHIPTGKKVDMKGYSIISLNNDLKINQEELFYNELDLLQQMGYTLVPPILQ